MKVIALEISLRQKQTILTALRQLLDAQESGSDEANRTTELARIVEASVPTDGENISEPETGFPKS